MSNVSIYSYKIEAPWGIGVALRSPQPEWGAIAVNPQTGKFGYATTYWDEGEAEVQAKMDANEPYEGYSERNTVLVSGHRCYLAVAVSSSQERYGTSWDTYKPAKAGRRALRACGGRGQVVLTVNTTAPRRYAVWPNYMRGGRNLRPFGWVLAVFAVLWTVGTLYDTKHAINPVGTLVFAVVAGMGAAAAFICSRKHKGT